MRRLTGPTTTGTLSWTGRCRACRPSPHRMVRIVRPGWRTVRLIQSRIRRPLSLKYQRPDSRLPFCTGCTTFCCATVPFPGSSNLFVNYSFYIFARTSSCTPQIAFHMPPRCGTVADSCPLTVSSMILADLAVYYRWSNRPPKSTCSMSSAHCSGRKAEFPTLRLSSNRRTNLWKNTTEPVDAPSKPSPAQAIRFWMGQGWARPLLGMQKRTFGTDYPVSLRRNKASSHKHRRIRYGLVWNSYSDPSVGPFKTAYGPCLRSASLSVRSSQLHTVRLVYAWEEGVSPTDVPQANELVRRHADRIWSLNKPKHFIFLFNQLSVVPDLIQTSLR